MKRVVLCSTSSTIRRLFARSELPVSVTSTIASASLGGFTSVAPQLNSTLAVHAVPLEVARGQADRLGGDPLALEVLDVWMGESSGTHSTQRTGRRLTFEKTSSATSCTSAPFSTIQS